MKNKTCWFDLTETGTQFSGFETAPGLDLYFFPLLSILFSSRMLLVAFCVQVLFAVSGSTWLLLLAAAMLTFHRPNADLTLEVIPDDLLENKLLRIKKKKRKRGGETTNTRGLTRTNMHTTARTSQKSFPLTIRCIALAKGGKCKICNKLGRCAASSEECVGDVPVFWLKMEGTREGGSTAEGCRELWDHFQLSCIVTASLQTLRDQWWGQWKSKAGSHKWNTHICWAELNLEGESEGEENRTICVCVGGGRMEGGITWKSWVTEVLVCMIWFLFTPLSVPGERGMLTDEGRQKSDEGLGRGVNELFPQAVLLTMRVSIEPLMTGGCSIAHILTSTPTPSSLPPLSSSCCISLHIPLCTSTYVLVHIPLTKPRTPAEQRLRKGKIVKVHLTNFATLSSPSHPAMVSPVLWWLIKGWVFEWGPCLITNTEL